MRPRTRPPVGSFGRVTPCYSGTKRVPKTRFLQIRLSPEDRDRVDAAAAGSFLDASTWARQVILRALDDEEKRADPQPRTLLNARD